jgi:hypothetical protein
MGQVDYFYTVKQFGHWYYLAAGFI